jgi:hypothetical protein
MYVKLLVLRAPNEHHSQTIVIAVATAAICGIMIYTAFLY